MSEERLKSALTEVEYFAWEPRPKKKPMKETVHNPPLPIDSPLNRLINAQHVYAEAQRNRDVALAAAKSERVWGTIDGYICIYGIRYTTDVASNIARDIFKILGEDNE